MHVYLFTGIVVALALTELTGFSPGGIVVAGYLAMFLTQPQWIVGTVVAALITYGIIELIKNHVLLYGRRLFAAYVLVGIVVAQVASYLLLAAATLNIGLLVIGYLIPGLIARTFDRQGIFSTTLWLIIAVVLTRLIVMAGEGWLW